MFVDTIIEVIYGKNFYFDSKTYITIKNFIPHPSAIEPLFNHLIMKKAVKIILEVEMRVSNFLILTMLFSLFQGI